MLIIVSLISSNIYSEPSNPFAELEALPQTANAMAKPAGKEEDFEADVVDDSPTESIDTEDLVAGAEESLKKDQMPTNVVRDAQGNILRKENGDPITSDDVVDTLDELNKKLQDPSTDEETFDKTLATMKNSTKENPPTKQRSKSKVNTLASTTPVDTKNTTTPQDDNAKKGLSGAEIGLIVSTSVLGGALFLCIGAVLVYRLLMKRPPSDEKIRAQIETFNAMFEDLRGFVQDSDRISDLSLKQYAKSQQIIDLVQQIDNAKAKGFFSREDEGEIPLDVHRAIMVQFKNKFLEINQTLSNSIVGENTKLKTLLTDYNTKLNSISSRGMKQANRSLALHTIQELEQPIPQRAPQQRAQRNEQDDVKSVNRTEQGAQDANQHEEGAQDANQRRLTIPEVPDDTSVWPRPPAPKNTLLRRATLPEPIPEKPLPKRRNSLPLPARRAPLPLRVWK